MIDMVCPPEPAMHARAADMPSRARAKSRSEDERRSSMLSVDLSDIRPNAGSPYGRSYPTAPVSPIFSRNHAGPKLSSVAEGIHSAERVEFSDFMVSVTVLDAEAQLPNARRANIFVRLFRRAQRRYPRATGLLVRGRWLMVSCSIMVLIVAALSLIGLAIALHAPKPTGDDTWPNTRLPGVTD
jgi:hypothetical protein